MCADLAVIDAGERKTPIKACFDCGATVTPMWRNGEFRGHFGCKCPSTRKRHITSRSCAGPAGPKKYCNACGVRHMRGKRARDSGSDAEVAGNFYIKVHLHESVFPCEMLTICKTPLQDHRTRRFHRQTFQRQRFQRRRFQDISRVFRTKDAQDRQAPCIIVIPCVLADSLLLFCIPTHSS